MRSAFGSHAPVPVLAAILPVVLAAAIGGCSRDTRRAGGSDVADAAADAADTPAVSEGVEAGDIAATDDAGVPEPAETADAEKDPADTPRGDGCIGSRAETGMCTDDGWCWMSQWPQGEFLHRVWCSSIGDCWAAGMGGLTLHWDGVAWTRVPTGTSEAIEGLWGSGPNDVWAVGPFQSWGPILHWDGSNWDYLDGPESGSWYRAVSGWGPESVWAVGLRMATSPGGRIAHWDGSGWALEPLDPIPPINQVYAVRAVGLNEAWAVGSSGLSEHVLLRRTAAGWEVVPTEPLGYILSIWASGPEDVWFTEVMPSGAPSGWTPLLRWNGASLERVHLPKAQLLPCLDEVDETYRWYNVVGGSGRDDVWVIGGIGMWHWDGTAWTPNCDLGARGLEDINAVHVDSPWHAVAVGVHGYTAVWNGTCWREYGSRPLSPAPSTYDAGLWSTGPDDTWIARGDGDFHHWDGTTWSAGVVAPSAQGDVTVSALWGAASESIWGAGFEGPPRDGCTDLDDGFPSTPPSGRGRIVHWDGVAWSGQEIGDVPALCAVWGAGSNEVWAAGAGGTVLRWDGSAWVAESPAPIEFIRSIWGAAPGELWAAGEDAAGMGVAARRKDGQWTTLWTGTQKLAGVWAAGPEDVWVVGRGIIQRWDGKDWIPSEFDSLFGECRGIWGFGPDDVWVHVLGPLYMFQMEAIILHWDGSDWRGESLGIANGPLALMGSRPGDLWMTASGGGGVLRRRSSPQPPSGDVGTDGEAMAREGWNGHDQVLQAGHQ